MSGYFADRAEAGRLLAPRLAPYADRSDVIVLALPRGGVAVAFEIAQALHAPLDVLLVRKLGVPGREELAFGAIASGGVRILDPDIIEAFGIPAEVVDRVIAKEESEMNRREAAFRAGRPPIPVQGRVLILVDDGIATGSTMRAAISAAKRLGAARIVIAAGVAPLSTSLVLSSEADEFVCPFTPRDFRSVSLFYRDFPQLTDEDVRHFLQRAAESATPSAG